MERGVGRLVDRRLFGHRHEHHLTALRIAQHAHDVGGLLADGAGCRGVEQSVCAGEECDRVPGRRSVDDDEVGTAREARADEPFDLLDLAEHEQVLQAWHGSGDNVERARVRQPAGDPAQTVAIEVLDQGVVGGHSTRGSAADPGPARPGARRTDSS